MGTVGPYGDSNEGGQGVSWSWKPSGPITRIELVGNSMTLHSIRFKSNNKYSATIGQNNATVQAGLQVGFDINSPSEYLIGISGAYSDRQSTKYFLGLSFETNVGNIYGPFPQSGTYRTNTAGPTLQFSYRTPDGSPILGFHGSYGCDGTDLSLNSIGVYVKPPPPPPSLPPPTLPALLVNGWGGQGGRTWNFQLSSDIKEIIIFHGNAIDSLQFKTWDDKESQKFGGSGGNKGTVKIKRGVSLTGIKGTFGPSRWNDIVVTSLSFITSDGDVPGLFGKHLGTEFSFSIEGSIVGFHGRAAGLIDSIGVYVEPKS